MELLDDFLATVPDDPVLLAGAVLLAWLPVCAAGLGGLALLTALQYQWGVRRSRRRPRATMIVPPVTARPLVTRRYISARAPRSRLAALRAILVVGAVVAVTALALAASAGDLLDSARSQQRLAQQLARSRAAGGG